MDLINSHGYGAVAVSKTEVIAAAKDADELSGCKIGSEKIP